ncbi:uncharacterized protein BDCG_06678 [Blastomyces dermatitidis ER-3]|uniref:Uncharacterized protein n=1 Tax=Ajellomyces dermatitidis (strain ER-3 / ATCC MYA-2586) TaxID=559297 RepID=A0ABP2F3R8_AJEDR|nr:uncharacterized protein BDCG_06678 [Blastomyces dermatitidis ER-3]EEQ91558.2 hypothetical protein BDCG_06678 [Blastomyces dermatitidis ER-3]
MSAKRHLIETMAATCHSVVSPTLHQAPRNDCGKHTNPTSEQIRKLVLRIPKESTQPLHLYQLRHEVAYLQYLAQKLRSLLRDKRLSVAWPQLPEDQKKLGGTRFDFIGGLDPDAHCFPGSFFLDDLPLGPCFLFPCVVEGNNCLSCSQAKFHPRDCHNIGPSVNSKDYILSCYDREIYYDTHANRDEILLEAFEKYFHAKYHAHSQWTSCGNCGLGVLRVSTCLNVSVEEAGSVVIPITSNDCLGN